MSYTMELLLKNKRELEVRIHQDDDTVHRMIQTINQNKKQLYEIENAIKIFNESE